jgi:hypothetical protein
MRRLAAEHLDEFLGEARAQHDKPPPAYVEKELRAFIECGIAEFDSRSRSARAAAGPGSREGNCASCVLLQ